MSLKFLSVQRLNRNLKGILMFFYLVFFVFWSFVFVSESLSESLTESVELSERDRLILNIIKRHDGEVDSSNGLPWGTHNAPKGYHSNFERGTRVHPTRAAMERAIFLLASPYAPHRVEGNKILSRVLELQDSDPSSKTFGLWSWYAEESLERMASVDYNWADFQGAVLVIILHDFSHCLEPTLRLRAERSLEYCCSAIMRRNVGPAYTNIAITGATVTAAAGEILRRVDFLEFGRRRILRSLSHFRASGAFVEYNSPAYLPVVIEELERMLYLVSDIECRKAAKELLTYTWVMLAVRYHVPTGELAGPHSRSYSDRLSLKTRNMIFARLVNSRGQNKPAQSALEASVLVPMRRIDEVLERYFLIMPTKPREVKNLFIKNRPAFDVVGTTWMDTRSVIGTASYHTFWEQSRGLIGYWVIDNGVASGVDNFRNVKSPVIRSSNDTVAVFRLRFKHNGKDFASAWGRHYQKNNRVITAIGLLNNQGSMHPSMDCPRDGIFRASLFEIEYYLDGFGSVVRQIDKYRYELSAGAVRVIIHTMPESRFDGKPIVWKMSSNLTSAVLTGVCYEGKEREFDFAKLGDTRIVLGLELLQDKQTKESDAKIKIVETKFQTKREGNFYAIIWQNLNENEPLLAPIKPTQK
jgi:hypothetical protein